MSRRTGLPIGTLATMVALKVRADGGVLTNRSELTLAPLQRLQALGFVEEFTIPRPPRKLKPDQEAVPPATQEPPPVRVRLTEAGMLALAQAQQTETAAPLVVDTQLRRNARDQDVDEICEELRRQNAIMQQRWQRVVRAYLALRDVRSLRDNEPHTPQLARFIEARNDLQKNDLQVLK